LSITRLELRKSDFFPNLFASESLSVTRLSTSAWRFAAFLWRNVDHGGDSRGDWQDSHWQGHLSVPGLEFYAVLCDEEPAGCCEILRAPRLMTAKGGAARMTSFGLMPEYADEGLGSALMTRMVEKAFSTGASKLTMSVSRELSPAMLRICRSQGFRLLESVG
jgi:ribosomal protein S18 acetylase RimI-like enzyme